MYGMKIEHLGDSTDDLDPPQLMNHPINDITTRKENWAESSMLLDLSDIFAIFF